MNKVLLWIDKDLWRETGELDGENYCYQDDEFFNEIVDIYKECVGCLLEPDDEFIAVYISAFCDPDDYDYMIATSWINPRDLILESVKSLTIGKVV